MKTSIIFSDDTKQINFTPENDNERQALKLITLNDNIGLAVKQGSFSDSGLHPFSIEVNKCRGGYLRAFTSDESIMLVLTPKVDKEPQIDSEIQASQFTASALALASTLLSDDYKLGFKEGVEKYIQSQQNK